MDATYKVRGADGKEYGPASLEQLSAWLREGRITPQTEVMRSDVDYWAPAGQYQELQSPAPARPPAPPVVGGTTYTHTQTSSQPGQIDPAAIGRLKSSASWFYWIAGLSLINSISAFSGSSWSFFFGLGITHIISGMFASNAAIGLALNLVVLAVFVVFGVFANKGHLWAFITGTVLFALDALIFLMAKDWIGLGLHVVVVVFLIPGLKACIELNRAR